MKLLLADDETLVRLGLKSMIEELYPGQHTFIEAANGEELVTIVGREQPDIVFLDIHMPKRNGLDALELFRSQQIAVIMLTGYAEFEYAKKALTLGAIEYLLKPASLDEVKQAIDRAIAYCRSRFDEMLKDYHLELTKTLELYHSIDFISSSRLIAPPLTLALFYLDLSDYSGYQQWLEQLFFYCRSRLIDLGIAGACSILPGGEICFICNGVLPPTVLPELVREYQQQENKTLTAFTTLSASVEELLTDINKLRSLSSIRICHQLGTVISYDRFDQLGPFLPLSADLEKVAIAYRSSDTISFHDIIAKLKNNTAYHNQLKQCDWDSLNRYFALIMPHFEAAPKDPSDLIEALCSFDSHDQNQDLISAIQAYVEKNYMNQIGINTIAERLNISPNYLSKIYKANTGENFIDYLTAVRVEKAKQLFKLHPEITVKAVASQVGYFSNRYFTKVFLKHTAMLPSEYQKSKRIEYTNI